jgi:hypothetical protein
MEPFASSTDPDAATDLDVADSASAISIQAQVETAVVDEAAPLEMPLADSVASDDPADIINKLNNWLNNIRLRRDHV